jgi:DNA-directed RNA polymerase specialized sigma24 family protein
MMKINDFEAKAKTIRAKLLKSAMQQLACKEEAEDLVQECLLRLWCAQDRWLQYQNPEAVAMRTLRNLIIRRFAGIGLLPTQNPRPCHEPLSDFQGREKQQSYAALY